MDDQDQLRGVYGVGELERILLEKKKRLADKEDEDSEDEDDKDQSLDA